MIDTVDGSAGGRSTKMRALSMPDLMDMKDIQAFDEALVAEEKSKPSKPAGALQTSSSAISLLSPSSSAADLIAMASRALSKCHPIRAFSVGLNRSMSLPRESSISSVSCTEQKSPLGSEQDTEDGDFFMAPLDDDVSACSNDSFNPGLEQSSSGYLPRFYSAEKLSTLIPPNSRTPSLPGKVHDTQKRARFHRTEERSGTRVQRSANRRPDVESPSEVTRVTSSQDKLPLVPRDFTTKMRAREVAMSNLEAFTGKQKQPAQTHPSPQSVAAFQSSTHEEVIRRSLFSSSSSRGREQGQFVSGNDAKHNIARSTSMDTRQLEGNRPGAALYTINRRSIFGKNSQEPCAPKPPRPVTSKESISLDHSEDQIQRRDFKLLRHDDRANSLPVTMPSTGGGLSPSPSSTSLLPRRSSLKKVSSLKNISSNSGDNASSTTSGMKQNVSFSNLSIREYEVTLGDNPSCSMGPPISLGWEYRDTAVLSLDEFETTRERHFPRRSSDQLMLSYNVRRYLLLKTAGCTKAELREAMKEVERIKRERKVTDLLMPACMLDEVMEDVVERVKSMFGKNENQQRVE